MQHLHGCVALPYEYVEEHMRVQTIVYPCLDINLPVMITVWYSVSCIRPVVEM